MTRLPALTAALCLLATIATTEETPGDPLSLIPESPIPVAKPKPKPAPSPEKKSSTEQASDDLQTRIRYREAKTKAMQDPKVQAEWDRAHAVKTDAERRAALKSYYNLYCDRMEKIDPVVKPRVELLRKSLAWRFDPGPQPLRKEKPAKSPEEEAEREAAREAARY